jgi:hypothetical protein
MSKQATAQAVVVGAPAPDATTALDQTQTSELSTFEKRYPQDKRIREAAMRLLTNIAAELGQTFEGYFQKLKAHLKGQS